MGSRQIGWWSVYELLAPLLGDRPPALPGTPTWQQLPDDHPDKWRALLWSAVWWSLTQDTRQEAAADASREISTAADWSNLAHSIRNGRGDAYIPRQKGAA
ncbi:MULTISPECIES: DUF2742 domain-containing protein [Mycolicibacterium]|uniref:DUF2742 domain-containing protein n=1 Tax=Mycolicibacterium TaxID=1866885 RepID=UPI00148FC35A|nr:DUF2742 domain-containing protein [Mycolicibacterium fortuitum]